MVAYGGLNDKIVSVIENTITTLLGLIEESAAKQGKDIGDDIAKFNKGNSDGK